MQGAPLHLDSNPVYRNGLNFSVHIGYKHQLVWKVGQALALTDLSKESSLEKIYHCRFCQIPEDVLKNYHVEGATLETLEKELREAYKILGGVPSEELSNMFVTCLGYYV